MEEWRLGVWCGLLAANGWHLAPGSVGGQPAPVLPPIHGLRFAMFWQAPIQNSSVPCHAETVLSFLPIEQP